MKAIHKVNDILRLGMHSLWVHAMRSALTALGIIIAVCSVIVMMAINEGTSKEAQRALRALGSDNIIIESVKPPDAGTQTGDDHAAFNYGLTNLDVERMRGCIPGIVRSSITHRTQQYAHMLNVTLPVTVIATEPVFAEIARIKPVAGRFITNVDLVRRKPYCVMTRELARRLFAYRDCLGQTIRLGAESFVIVGLLEEMPIALGGQGENAGNVVIIPQSVDSRRFGQYTVNVSQGSRSFEKVEVSQIILQMADERAVLDGADIARSLLLRNHSQQDYRVTVPRELIEQKQRQQRLWNIMFLSIASISLVVGGIGIMNIMLASVTERTREIGIRRALGAKRRDIVVQFLVEAVALTTAGGILGIGIGVMLPKLLEYINSEIKTEIVPALLMLPLSMAVGVGLIAGLYPAIRAAALDPITALRHE
jgi:putative ABC transport system permease protein